MSLRNNTRQKGDIDYSNIGVSGRRTGLVLPQGRLDVNGIEEISGIFSSPRKPSPLRKVSSARGTDDAGATDNSTTPKQAQSTRRTPARSASPRKSGIGGTARRSNAIYILNQNSTKRNQLILPKETDKSPRSDLRNNARSQSPLTSRPPLGPTPSTRKSNARTKTFDDEIQSYQANKTRHVSISSRDSSQERSPDRDVISERNGTPGALNTDDDDDQLPPMYDDEEFSDVPELEKPSAPLQKEQMTANSRRKRKSDAIDADYEPEVASSPSAKRAKRISDGNTSKEINSGPTHPQADAGQTAAPKSLQSHARPILKAPEKTNTMSARQQSQLDTMVESIRSRPGQHKSLYVLRREVGDDDAVQTRSGRVSVKPLAYWRNERCVYGGSPNGPMLADGARFPLNSIKEIIRTEELGPGRSKKGRKAKKKQEDQKESGQDDQQSASNVAVTIESSDEEYEDPDAEEWETEIGTVRGPVAVWDNEQQTAIREEEDVDIAYAAGAIQKESVKDSDFKYAKLLSTRFFGSGLVELPAGAIKKPKNSRKMHMSFFVAKGRVAVSVGSLEGPENRFSIGKGGFWQVPRGNQYSIENEHEKTAVVFFSQACEPGPWYGQ